MKVAQATRGRARLPRRAGRAFRWPSWVAVGVLLVGLGVSGAAGVVRRASVRQQEHQAFQLTASSVTATLSTLLERDADFVDTFRALLSVQPHMSATLFSHYFMELAGQQREIGSVGSAIVSRVPARDLTVFEARRDTDPAFQAILGKWLAPVPRGPQKQYCLLSAGRELTAMTDLTARLVQQDWCNPASALGAYQVALLTSATDSGESVAVPVDLPWIHTEFLETAVYAHGAALHTVAQRRAAVTGWVISSFDIPAVIRAAVGGDPALSVRLYHTNPGERPVVLGAVGPSKAAGRLRQSTSLSIHGSWRVTVLGSPPGDGLGADQQGVLVFAMAAVISVLVALIAFSRQRALELVAEKTAELRHQALHDPLTGLANRVLAIDRAEQMLARARRSEADAAALYVDLDGFKQVNDTFGHAAGDELLQQVAGRLDREIRASDTAARLAGDEFLVLLDASKPDGAPELVAERIRTALRETYLLDSAGGREVSLTASIGIALARRQGAEALLAEADAAMYAAKSSGKDRCVAFEPAMHAE